MLRITATIDRDTRPQKHQAGWTFIILTNAQSEKLNPGVRQSYRVKGKIDAVEFRQKALLPVSGNRMMFTVDARMRKALDKQYGDKVKLELEVDKKEYKLSGDLLACLQDDPSAEDYFNSLAPSHQRYFSKWIEDAKTEHTKAKRITMALMALSQKKDYGKMLREAAGKPD